MSCKRESVPEKDYSQLCGCGPNPTPWTNYNGATFCGNCGTPMPHTKRETTPALTCSGHDTNCDCDGKCSR